MTGLSGMFLRAIFSTALSAYGTPDDFSYWIAHRGSLGLHFQLLGFAATAWLVAFRSEEMKNVPMAVAMTLSSLSLMSFVIVGLHMSPGNAHVTCFLLNGLQGMIFVGLMAHRHMNTISGV